jgi:hypothetical protein
VRGGERGRRRFNGFRFCALPLAFFYDVGAILAYWLVIDPMYIETECRKSEGSGSAVTVAQ